MKKKDVQRWLRPTALLALPDKPICLDNFLWSVHNIGIIAHVTGKTTVSEYPLLHRPRLKLGEVHGEGHHGLDGAGTGARVLPATSAATTCFWKGITTSTSLTHPATWTFTVEVGDRCAYWTAAWWCSMESPAMSRNRSGVAASGQVPYCLALLCELDRTGADFT